MGRACDWPYWRNKFVTGDDDLSLQRLSELPEAPALQSIKNRSSKESWYEQRKAFRRAVAVEADKAIAAGDVTGKTLAKVDALIDAAETITRHVKLARKMQSLVVQRLRDMKPNELSPRDLIAFINASTAIERLALGMATEHTKIDIDLSKLDDRELEAIARGN